MNYEVVMDGSGLEWDGFKLLIAISKYYRESIR